MKRGKAMSQELEELYNDGIEIGKNIATIKSIQNVMLNLKKTAEEAMDILNIGEEYRENYKKQLNN